MKMRRASLGRFLAKFFFLLGGLAVLENLGQIDAHLKDSPAEGAMHPDGSCPYKAVLSCSSKRLI